MKAIVNSTAAVLILVIFSAVSAESDMLSWSGKAEYRFRTNINGATASDGEEADKSIEYQHKTYWNLGLEAAPKDNLTFNIGLQEVSDDPNNSAYPVRGVLVNEAAFEVTAGMLDFSAGILQQGNTAALNLFWGDGTYHNVVSSTWADETNGALNATRLALNPSDNLSLRVTNALWSDKINTDEDWVKKTSFLHIVEAPLKAGVFSLNPHMYLQRSQNWEDIRTEAEAGNDIDAVHTFGTGIDMKAKVTDALEFRGGFGISTFTNENEGYEESPFGMLVDAETRVKPGFGQFRARFMLSQGYDRDDESNDGDPLKQSGIRIDSRYVMPVKNISITPRVRYWAYTNNNDDDETKKTRLRPELIFTAKF
ncbi:MAG: hypothetical protein ACQEQ4_04115 [Fibrobacterota bacterium]